MFKHILNTDDFLKILNTSHNRCNIIFLFGKKNVKINLSSPLAGQLLIEKKKKIMFF